MRTGKSRQEKDLQKVLRECRQALALGGAKPLPELFHQRDAGTAPVADCPRRNGVLADRLKECEHDPHRSDL